MIKDEIKKMYNTNKIYGKISIPLITTVTKITNRD